jgi:hypothetical protein
MLAKITTGSNLTVLPGLVTIFALVPTVIIWFLAFNNEQLLYWIYYPFNTVNGYLFSATRSSKAERLQTQLFKAKVKLLEKHLYGLHGYFKKSGIVSNQKKAITKHSQFNLRATNQGDDNYGYVISQWFRSDFVYTTKLFNLVIDKHPIGHELENSANRVLDLWMPLVEDKITGLTAYAIQTAIIADYLNVVITVRQAEIIWEAIFSCYNPKSSDGLDHIMVKDLKQINDLLKIYIRDNNVIDEFEEAMIGLKAPFLSNQIYLLFLSLIKRG